MSSRWKFPGGANNTAIASTAYPSVEFNSSVISYLRLTASNPPTDGLGSTRSVYVNDILNAEWQTSSNEVLEQWCLVCTAPYSGRDGWDACESFTDPATTQLLYRDRVGPAMRYSHIVGDINRVFDLDNSTSVSAAICSFGVPLSPANPMPSPNFDFSAPYPLINVDRKSATGDDVRYQFSADIPDGKSEAIPTPQTSYGYSSPTTGLRTPEYTSRPNESNDDGSNKGLIAGIVVGVLGVIVAFAAILLCIRNSKKKKAAAVPVRQMGISKPVLRQWSLLESGEAPPPYEVIHSVESLNLHSSTHAAHR